MCVASCEHTCGPRAGTTTMSTTCSRLAASLRSNQRLSLPPPLMSTTATLKYTRRRDDRSQTPHRCRCHNTVFTCSWLQRACRRCTARATRPADHAPVSGQLTTHEGKLGSRPSTQHAQRTMRRSAPKMSGIQPCRSWACTKAAMYLRASSSSPMLACTPQQPSACDMYA